MKFISYLDFNVNFEKCMCRSDKKFRTPKSGRPVRQRYDAVRQILQVFHGSYTLLFGIPDEPIKVSILQKSNLFPAKQNQTHQEAPCYPGLTIIYWIAITAPQNQPLISFQARVFFYTLQGPGPS